MYDSSTKMRGQTTFSEPKWNYFGYYLGNIILMYKKEERGKAKQNNLKKNNKQRSQIKTSLMHLFSQV
jgi:hypothetical protein